MSTTSIPSTAAIYIKKVPKMGRGVFAGKNLRKGQTIEVCPVLELPWKQRKDYGEFLEDYVFGFGKKQLRSAIALGYGSLYNHSNEANALWFCNRVKQTIRIRAKKYIPKGQQIFINYEWGKKQNELSLMNTHLSMPTEIIPPSPEFSQVTIQDLEKMGLWTPHLMEAAACKAVTRIRMIIKQSRNPKRAKIKNY